MRNEIHGLSTCLNSYEKKWSKIVKNVIRENADLKMENNKLKKKITSIKTLHSLAETIDTNA
jgi:regulator of replication initiation timing